MRSNCRKISMGNQCFLAKNSELATNNCGLSPIKHQAMNYFSDAISQLVWHLPVNLTMLAQNINDPDVLGQMQQTWNNFVQTGQVWALLVGLIIGYVLRGLTSYG